MKLDKLFEETEEGCWRWKLSLTSRGYGQYQAMGECLAHRVFYKIFISPEMPEQVMHLCNNKWCVNPAHLRGGTAKDNYEHAVECGLQSDKDQRFGRQNTKGKILPKGITYDAARKNFKCSIRKKPYRYQSRQQDLVSAISWRIEMEQELWATQLTTGEN